MEFRRSERERTLMLEMTFKRAHESEGPSVKNFYFHFITITGDGDGTFLVKYKIIPFFFSTFHCQIGHNTDKWGLTYYINVNKLFKHFVSNTYESYRRQ